MEPHNAIKRRMAKQIVVEWKRNVTAQAQKPDSVFQRNGRVHLYQWGCQFSRVLAFLECGSAENDSSNTGRTVPGPAEDCWLPTPFASFPFTSPPVRHQIPFPLYINSPPWVSPLAWLGLADIARKRPFLNMWDVPTQHSVIHVHGTHEISYGSFPRMYSA